MTIVVDSDALIGSLNPQDFHYNVSQKILHKLTKKDAKLVYPATVIVETITFLQGRLNQPKLADRIINLVKHNLISIETVDAEVIKRAGEMMDFKRSKHHTLFDCIVAVIAVEIKADAIFSFDRFYEKKGFKLASDL